MQEDEQLSNSGRHAGLNKTEVTEQSQHDSGQVEEDESGGISVEKGLQKAGGWGRFQWLLTLSQILGMNSIGLVVNSVLYFELDPLYLCTYIDDSGAEVTQDCTREEMCATNNFISFQIDTSSPYSLINWNQQLDMYCTQKVYIGLIGASAFAGSAVACLVLPVLGDKIGRLPVFLTTQLFQVPMYIAAIYTNQIGVVTFLVYYLGFCLIGRFTCGFVLFVELLPEKYKALSGTAILVGYSISLLESTFYYSFISKNSITLIWIGFVLNVLTFGANLFMPESPVWLISAGRYEEARDTLRKIAKYNGIENLELPPFKQELNAAPQEARTVAPGDQAARYEESENLLDGAKVDKESQLQKMRQSFQDGDVERLFDESGVTFCNPKSVFVNLVIFTVLWSVSMFNYYLINFYMKYVPGNIFVNTTASGLSENLAYVVSGFVLSFLDIKLSYIVAFVLATIGGALLVAIPATGLLEAGFILFAKFGISFAFNNCYLATPMLFPAHLRVTAFGICHLLASFVTIIAPLMAEVDPPTPMVFFTLFSVVAGFATLALNTKTRYE